MISQCKKRKVKKSFLFSFIILTKTHFLEKKLRKQQIREESQISNDFKFPDNFFAPFSDCHIFFSDDGNSFLTVTLFSVLSCKKIVNYVPQI